MTLDDLNYQFCGGNNYVNMYCEIAHRNTCVQVLYLVLQTDV